MVHLPRPDVPAGFPDRNAFATWAGPGATLLEGAGLDSSDFTGEGPFVVRCFHGTTHRFDRFDASVRGHIEGQFGAVHYFSTSPDDAWTNYALPNGADLTNRVEQVAERIAQDLEHDPGAEDDADFMALGRQAALAQLVGDGSYLLDCVVRIERPFLLGTYRRWPVPGLVAYDSFEPLDSSLDPEEDEDAYWDSVEEARESQVEALRTAFATAADALGLDATPDVPDALLDDRFDGTATDLETVIKDATCYLEHPDTGALVSSAFFGQVVKALGFDAIVLLNANQRFQRMEMDHGTAHVHLFDGAGARVKFFDAERFYPADDTLSN
jgi:hypothetical protein